MVVFYRKTIYLYNYYTVYVLSVFSGWFFTISVKDDWTRVQNVEWWVVVDFTNTHMLAFSTLWRNACLWSTQESSSSNIFFTYAIMCMFRVVHLILQVTTYCTWCTNSMFWLVWCWSTWSHKMEHFLHGVRIIYWGQSWGGGTLLSWVNAKSRGKAHWPKTIMTRVVIPPIQIYPYS